jgi:hypothetical protein
MQNKYLKFLLIALIVIFVVPQIALAAWWNPISWNIWNIFFPKQTPTTQQQKRNNQTAIQNISLKKNEPTTPQKELQKPQDIKDCENFNGGYKDNCILTLTIAKAISTKNPALCKNVKAVFVDYCYSGVAVELKDPKICEEIQNRTVKESFTSLYDQCYYTIATKTNDENLCNPIKSNDKFSLCNSEIATSKKDVSICEKIKGRDNKQNFYYNQCIRLPMNIGSLDCSVGCEKTLGEAEKNECYIQCAKKKNDISYCEKISFSPNFHNRTPEDNKQSEIERKNTCYDEVATGKKDISICEKIMPSIYGNKNAKEDCIQYIQQLLR